MSKKTKLRCCLCGNDFTGWGHNPEPFGAGNERCCQDCNDFYVVPTRLVVGRVVTIPGLLRLIGKLASASGIIARGRELERTVELPPNGQTDGAVGGQESNT
jgi:hypothetical protein